MATATKTTKTYELICEDSGRKGYTSFGVIESGRVVASGLSYHGAMAKRDAMKFTARRAAR